MSRLLTQLRKDPLVVVLGICLGSIPTAIGYFLFLSPPIFAKRKLVIALLALLFLGVLFGFLLATRILPRFRSLSTGERILNFGFCLAFAASLVLVLPSDYLANQMLWLANRKVDVIVPGIHNPNSSGSRVTIHSIELANRHSINYDVISRSDTWVKIKEGLETSGETPAWLSWTGHANQFMILFFEGAPDAGIVEIHYGGKTYPFDLYTEPPRILSHSIEFSLPPTVKYGLLALKFLLALLIAIVATVEMVTPNKAVVSSYTNSRSIRPRLVAIWRLFCPYIFLVALGFVAYGKGLSIPSLFGDEWSMVSDTIFNGFSCINRSIFLRPLIDCYFITIRDLFGINLFALRATSLFLSIFAAICLYRLLNTLMPSWPSFNLIVSSLFLVFPTAVNHLKIESGYPILSAIFQLISFIILFRNHQEPHALTLSTGIALLGLSFVVYEAGIGQALLVVLFWTLLSLRQKRREAFISHIAEIILILGFTCGRWIAQAQNPGIFGHALGTKNISLSAIIGRLIIGARLNYVSVWPDAFRLAFYKQPILCIALAIVLAMAVLALIWTWVSKLASRTDQKVLVLPSTSHDLVVILIAGVLISLAGFIPMITANVTPDLGHIQSRVNYLPAIGAALAWTALTALFARFLSSQKTILLPTFAVLATGLILSGTMKQFFFNERVLSIWEDQKAFWHQVVDTIPDFLPNTNVIISYLDPVHPDIEPFPNNYGISSTLAVLYGHKDLNGFVFDIAPEKLDINSEGIKTSYGWRAPFDTMVILQYKDKKLTVLSDEIQGFKLCKKCVLNRAPVDPVEYRYFIEAKSK